MPIDADAVARTQCPDRSQPAFGSAAKAHRERAVAFDYVRSLHAEGPLPPIRSFEIVAETTNAESAGSPTQPFQQRQTKWHRIGASERFQGLWSIVCHWRASSLASALNSRQWHPTRVTIFAARGVWGGTGCPASGYRCALGQKRK